MYLFELYRYEQQRKGAGVANYNDLNLDEPPHEHPVEAIDQELEAVVRALRHAELENKAFSARLKESRLEVAKLKAALLAGTSLECDEDDVGILGGMFICTYVQCGALHFLQMCFTARNSPNLTNRAYAAQSIPTRSAASLVRGPLAPSI